MKMRNPHGHNKCIKEVTPINSKKYTTRELNRIGTVTFTYVGTGKEFDRFLEMLIRDYLLTDNPYKQEKKAC